MIQRTLLPQLEKELASEKVIVLTGMRRVGKTTLIRYLYDHVTDRRKLYLDLENPLNQSYFNQVDYDKIKVYLDTLATGRGKDLVVFLDEIQSMKHIPSVVKYLFDHYHIKFVLTGSASFYLKNLFVESLSGRKRLFELYPLTFAEFLGFKAPNIVKPTPNKTVDPLLFDLMDKYIVEYLTYGGFPSVTLKDSHEEKQAELDDIITSYFQKEIQLLADFRKLEVMKSTMILLTSRIGSKLDTSKIASELGVNRITVEEYINFLEGTYFLTRLSPYSKTADVSIRGQKKVYVCDAGIINRMGNVPKAAVFENTVCTLLQLYGNRFFYQSKGGTEIDFIVDSGKTLSAFEVKTHPHQSDVSRLQRNAHKLGITTYSVISRTYSTLPHIKYLFQL